ncbi:MAG: hypothetical protein J7K72_04905 [Candidatus Aenigmarchaeota archaeon]|nr:hypothetical protein [Candidatus Aenigmarchaeota archaeon]
MGIKHYILAFAAAFACYLVFSLPFISAHETGLLFSDRTGIEPRLVILNDIPPISCSSRKYVDISLFVENVPEFDIKKAEMFVFDKDRESAYDVSSAISCFPTSNLVSNQEIKCRIKAAELLANTPKCPLKRIENRLDMILTLASPNKEIKVSASKSLIFYDPRVKPEMHIDFQATKPAYSKPVVNCRTGSEVKVPVVVTHSESVFGNISWSYTLNKTREYAGSLIKCERVYREYGDEYGRKDVYLCSLVIGSASFSECKEGLTVPIGIKLRFNRNELYDEFSTTTVSKDLNLMLSLGHLGRIECQIIDKNGTCIPKQPARNITATITGNVPDGIELIEAVYKLGKGNATSTLCRKRAIGSFECPVFITLDKLPMPEGNRTTKKSRQLFMSFDLKYLNYYINISDRTDVLMEGKVISDVLNTRNKLDEDSRFLKALKRLSNILDNVVVWVNFASRCCKLVDLASQMAQKVLGEEGKKKSLSEILDEYLNKMTSKVPKWGMKDFAVGVLKKSKILRGLIIDTLRQSGPKVIGCVAESGIKIIEKEKERLVKFENGEIKERVEIPDTYGFWTLIKDNAPKCFAKAAWRSVRSWTFWFSWLCSILMLVFAFYSPVIVGKICEWMTKISGPIQGMLNVLVALIAVLSIYEAYKKINEAVVLVRETINTQIKASNAMSDYLSEYKKSIENIIEGQMLNEYMSSVINPPMDMVMLKFVSDRVGVLSNGDEVCSGDMLSIEYNFEKLGQTKDFVSKLTISPGGRTLVFDGLKGVYGPYDVDIVLGTNPKEDKSQAYSFILVYQDKTLVYKLKYINHACA